MVPDEPSHTEGPATRRRPVDHDHDHDHYHFYSYPRTPVGRSVRKLRSNHFRRIIRTMSRQSVWATKVAALIKGNNSQAALAQIKVAPTVKDLQQLRALMTADGSLLKHRLIDEATRDQIVALSAPRLHRSP